MSLLVVGPPARQSQCLLFAPSRKSTAPRCDGDHRQAPGILDRRTDGGRLKANANRRRGRVLKKGRGNISDRGGAPILAAAGWRKFSPAGMSWFTESFELRISSKQRLCSTNWIERRLMGTSDLAWPFRTFQTVSGRLSVSRNADLLRPARRIGPASPASKLASRRSKVSTAAADFQEGVADRRGIHACLTQHNAGRAQR
jgi:hypothetical protein